MEESPSTILIVDDDVYSRETFRTSLLSFGFRLEFATNGPDALALATKEAPDLVLLDVMMPGMDGFEVCQRLRNDPLLAEVPVLMVTALEDRKSRLRGIQAGADDFISKPVDRAELRARVTTITRLNRYRRLVNERSKYDQLFEFSPAGILMLDGQFNIKLFNPAMNEMLIRSGLFDIDIDQHVSKILQSEYEACAAQLQILRSERANLVRFDAWLGRAGGRGVPVEIAASRVRLGKVTNFQLIAHDITERLHAEAVIRRRNEELARLSRRLVEVQEFERRQIARELHDEIGQALTGLKMMVEISSRLEGNERSEKLRQARELIMQLMGQVREMSLALRPTMLDDLGLVPALLWLTQRYKKQSGITVKLECELPKARLAADVETAVYRIVQEALTNVARYAGVDIARVTVAPRDLSLLITIADDGAGFNVAAAGQDGYSAGLSGMRERALALGGSFKVDSSPGSGTMVQALLPFRLADKADEKLP